jgi:hypothetical protein
VRSAGTELSSGIYSTSNLPMETHPMSSLDTPLNQCSVLMSSAAAIPAAPSGPSVPSPSIERPRIQLDRPAAPPGRKGSSDRRKPAQQVVQSFTYATEEANQITVRADGLDYVSGYAASSAPRAPKSKPDVACLRKQTPKPEVRKKFTQKATPASSSREFDRVSLVSPVPLPAISFVAPTPTPAALGAPPGAPDARLD